MLKDLHAKICTTMPNRSRLPTPQRRCPHPYPDNPRKPQRPLGASREATSTVLGYQHNVGESARYTVPQSRAWGEDFLSMEPTS